MAKTGRDGGFDWRVAWAFFAIYVVWGTTYYAIRVAVLQLPPLMTAGLRFFIAGVLLYGFMRLRGLPRPAMREWRGIGVTALFLFVTAYGALFWAEQYVPSGLASVIAASVPIITLALEAFVFRQQAFSWRAAGAVVTGFAGVAWLLLGPGQHALLLPFLAVLAAAATWSLGTVVTRAVALPSSPALTAGAQMMTGGAVLLVLSVAFGEWQHPLHVTWPALIALLYLITGGSLAAFTAYIWLLSRMSASRVVTYAYVNPVVALALGSLVGGERLTIPMVFASALVLASVIAVLKKGHGKHDRAEGMAGRDPARA